MYIWVFIGDGDSHRRRGKTRGKKTCQIPLFVLVSSVAAASDGLQCNFWSFKDYFVIFKLINVIFIYLFWICIYICKYGCKRKEKRKETKKIVKVYVCVFCICFYECFIYFLIYDKIAKIKKEFNILIGSRLRIINLYVSDISNFQWKDNY